MRLLSLLVVLVVLTASSSGQAQQQPSAETRQAARETFSRGQTLFREGQYAEAEAAFHEAYSLIPNPIVLKGIADARERAGNLTGAVEMYERYLSERTDVPAAERTEIETKVAEMRQRPGYIAITSTPSGAAILLDGEETGLTTPAEIEDAPPGEHALVLSLDGHEPAEEMITVPFGGRAEVAVTLHPEAPPTQTEADPMTGDSDPVELPEEDDDDSASEAADDGPGAAVWATSGVAAAALVTGTVLGFMALSREAEFDEMPDDETADQGERFALFADVAFGVAAAGAITAIVLFLTKDSGDDEEEASSSANVHIAPAIDRRGGGVSAHVQF